MVNPFNFSWDTLRKIIYIYIYIYTHTLHVEKKKYIKIKYSEIIIKKRIKNIP